MLKKTIYYIIIIGGIMNRKGFTLIELLAVIIVIALIATIVTPSVIEYVNSAKNTSYNLLIQKMLHTD